MPELPIYKYKISVINEDGISLDKIVRSPRLYKPQDLLAACGNTEIVSSGAQPCVTVNALVHYVFNEFFVYSHRTGLYNRQKSLWESISRINGVNVFQRKRGLFRKQPLPMYDIHFLDYRQRPLIAAHLIDPGAELTDKQLSGSLHSFLSRCERLSGLVGVLFTAPTPFPATVLERVAKITNGDDPVARYESILPSPLAVPLDLLEITVPADVDELPVDSNHDPWFRLVHPDLTVNRPRAVAASAVKDEPTDKL
jgi:hypothetical protein